MRHRQAQQPTLPAATQPPPRQTSPQPAVVGSQFVANSARTVPTLPAVHSTILASSIAPPNVASHTLVPEPPSPSRQSPIAPQRPAALPFDLHGVTASGSDGYDTAQRILRDLDHALGRTVRFSVSVPGKDLPAR
jgi:hypothetical protein